jgi:hypothetical protein
VENQVIEEAPEPQASVSGTTSRPSFPDDTRCSDSRSSVNVPPPSLFKQKQSRTASPPRDRHASRPKPRRAPIRKQLDPPDSSHANARPDPPQSEPEMIQLGDGGFQYPLEPPTEIDETVNYYEILECSSSALPSEIKLAYHRVSTQHKLFFES